MDFLRLTPPRSIKLLFPFASQMFGGRKQGAPRTRTGGFTLVEVAMALGIFSFGIVGVFGLLPIGLQVSRDSITQVMYENMIQQISSQAQLTDYQNLATSGTTYYFDDEGGMLNSVADQARKFYTVTTKFTPNTNIPNQNANSDSGVWDSMGTLEIDIKSVSRPTPVSTSIHIARLDHQ